MKYCVTCGSGTDALLIPLMAYNISEGDAVFTTNYSFFATTEVISQVGAKPIFVDIDPKTFNLDPELLESQIKDTIDKNEFKPKAIIAVDLFGQLADYSKIQKIAKKYNLLLIEDAAQSFGAKYKDKKSCSFGDVAATSFFPAKPLGCYGDGGAIFTNDIKYAEIFKSIRVHGQGTNKYDNVRIGLNSRLDTIQASVLLNKLTIFDDELLSRQNISLYYSNSNLTLEVSHKVNNHKYFCPETNLLLKTWSNAKIHKRNSGHTFSQKEMMVKHNQELIDKDEIHWDEPENLSPSPEVYSQAVRENIKSELTSPLELNIGSIIAIFHCRKYRHDFPFPAPSMKECKQYFSEYWKGQLHSLKSGGGWKYLNEESIQHAEKYIQLWMNEVFSSKHTEESMEVEVTDSNENFILNQRVANALKRRPDPKDYAFWKTRKNVLLVQNLMIEFTGNGHDRPPDLIEFYIATIFEKLFTFRYHQSSEKFRYRRLIRCFSDILST